MLTLLLSNCFSPHTKEASRRRTDASKEEVAKVVDQDLCGFGPHSWLLCDLGKALTFLCNMKLRCIASRFEPSVYGEICWLFGTKALVALCSWKRVSLCSTGWIRTHVRSPDWLKICVSPSTQPPKCWACRFQGVPLPQSSLFPSE